MRIILLEYLKNINLNNQGTLEAATKQAIFYSNNKDISLFLSKNDQIAQKIAEEIKHTVGNVKSYEITTDLKSNPYFQEIFQKRNSSIVTIFPSDNTFCDFLKEKSDSTKNTESVFGQIGSVKSIKLKKSSLQLVNTSHPNRL